MSDKKVFDYEGWVSALDKAESLGCPDLKDWEGQLDAIKDNGCDRYDDVDALESIAIDFIQEKGFKIINY